jgi:hypothetical protein
MTTFSRATALRRYSQSIHKKLQLFAEFTAIRSLESVLLTRFSTARLALVFMAGAAVLVTSAAALAEMPAGQTVDGIRCDSSEGAVFHIHQHLTILDHGKPIDIPSDVGRPEAGACFYWMHTHTSDGIVHVESPVMRTFTLGNFFDIWGEPLSTTHVAAIVLKKGQLHVFLDGEPYHGDPRSIEMSLHADIVLEAGAPFVKPTPFTDWQGN